MGVLKFPSSVLWKNTIRGLEGFSHVWLIYLFHASGTKWNALVRPPRLGGEKKVGVFSSRAPHRPNPIGISAVKLLAVLPNAPGGPEVILGGVDLLDGTPILDLKPYVPYSDALPDAQAGWAATQPERHAVAFSPEAEARLASRPGLRALIEQVLGLDPRPAFQARKLKGETDYAMKLGGFDVHWRVRPGAREAFLVTELKPLEPISGGAGNPACAWLEESTRPRQGRRKAGSSSKSRPGRTGPASRRGPRRPG